MNPQASAMAITDKAAARAAGHDAMSSKLANVSHCAVSPAIWPPMIGPDGWRTAKIYTAAITTAITAKHMPPIVGVLALAACDCGPSSLMNCSICLYFSHLIYGEKKAADITSDTSAVRLSGFKALIQEELSDYLPMI